MPLRLLINWLQRSFNGEEGGRRGRNRNDTVRKTPQDKDGFEDGRGSQA